MDLVNNLQQLLYTQGLLVFPARCLQTRSIWPYLHGAVRNLINQPQSASFAFPKHPSGPDLFGVASVSPWWGGGVCEPCLPPGVTRGCTLCQSPGCASTLDFGVCWVLVGAAWCFEDDRLPSVFQRHQYWGFSMKSTLPLGSICWELPWKPKLMVLWAGWSAASAPNCLGGAASPSDLNSPGWRVL